MTRKKDPRTARFPAAAGDLLAFTPPPACAIAKMAGHPSAEDGLDVEG